MLNIKSNRHSSKFRFNAIVGVALIKHPVTKIYKYFTYGLQFLHDLLIRLLIDLYVVVEDELIEQTWHHTCCTLIAVVLVFLLDADSLMDLHHQFH
jgi:hypothetical protein